MDAKTTPQGVVIARDFTVRGPNGEGYVTVSEFKKRFWKWAVTDYAHQPHSAIKDSPMAAWIKGKAARAIRPLRKKDDLRILLTRVEYLTPRRTGLHYKGLSWNAPVIKEIRSNPGWTRHDKSSQAPTAKIGTDLAKGKVKVRFNEPNMAQAWVTHPISRQMLPLAPSMKDYMEGLTLHEHILCQRIVDQYMDGLRNEENLLRARRVLREEALETHRRKSSRAVDRVRASRIIENRLAEQVKPVTEPAPVTPPPIEPSPPTVAKARRAVRVVRKD